MGNSNLFSDDPKVRPSRLWEYRLHQENIFYQRLNFFLVAESMLLVAFATLLTIETKAVFVLWTLTGLALFLTIIWLFVNRRQKQVIDSIRPLVEDACPVYKEIREKRPKTIFSSWKLLTYWVPIIVLMSWLILIFVIISYSK